MNPLYGEFEKEIHYTTEILIEKNSQILSPIGEYPSW